MAATVADRVARQRAERIARTGSATMENPSILRIVASIVAEYAKRPDHAGSGRSL